MKGKNSFKHTLSNIPSPLIKDKDIHIISVGHYKQYPVKNPFTRDFAPFYQMFFTVSGKGFINYEGKNQYLTSGTIACLDLRKHHVIDCCPDHTWEHYWVAFNGDLFDIFYATIFHNKNIHPVSEHFYLLNLFKEIFDWKQSNEIYFDLMAMSNILQICSYLLSNKGHVKEDINKNHIKAIQPAISYVHAKYSNNIYIKELAELCGYSPYHFSRIFRKCTGFSPNEYITKIRIEKAKDELSTKDVPIDLIAQQLGFSSQNYFIKVFKRWENMSPGQFRKLPKF